METVQVPEWSTDPATRARQEEQFRTRVSRAGDAWVQEYAPPWLDLLGLPPLRPLPTSLPIYVDEIGRRWGLYWEQPRLRQVLLHWALFLHPAPMIEYVLVHELVHATRPVADGGDGHGPAFWARFEEVFPTCRAAHEGHVGLRIDAWRTPPKLPQSAGDPAPRSSGPAPR